MTFSNVLLVFPVIYLAKVAESRQNNTDCLVQTAAIKRFFETTNLEEANGWTFSGCLCEDAHINAPFAKDRIRCGYRNYPNANAHDWNIWMIFITDTDPARKKVGVITHWDQLSHLPGLKKLVLKNQDFSGSIVGWSNIGPLVDNIGLSNNSFGGPIAISELKGYIHLGRIELERNSFEPKSFSPTDSFSDDIPHLQLVRLDAPALGEHINLDFFPKRRNLDFQIYDNGSGARMSKRNDLRYVDFHETNGSESTYLRFLLRGYSDSSFLRCVENTGPAKQLNKRECFYRNRKKSPHSTTLCTDACVHSPSNEPGGIQPLSNRAQGVRVSMVSFVIVALLFN